MVATLTSIYRGEASLPIQGICARYRGRPARARWCQNYKSIAQFAEYFRGGAPALGTFPGKHCAVRCRTTALQSPYRHFRLGQRLRCGINVMQPVSYSPSCLAFMFILYHPSRARRACWCSTRLASCLLLYFFCISLCSSLSLHRTFYVLCSV